MKEKRISPNNEENEGDRQNKDTFFLSSLADFPMEKQIRIDRCRELLNELALYGIAPEKMAAAENDLRHSVENFDNI